MSIKRKAHVRPLPSRTSSSEKEGSIINWLNNVREHSEDWVNEGDKTHSPTAPSSHVPSPELLRRKLEDLAAERRESEEAERRTEEHDNRSNTALHNNDNSNNHSRNIDNDITDKGIRGSNTVPVTLRLQKSTPEGTMYRSKHEVFKACRLGTPRRERTFTRQDLPLTVRVYRQVCRKLRILPLRRVMGQFGRKRIIFTDLCLSGADVRATCKALLHESSATYLDFSGNALEATECKRILNMLSANLLFTQLRLADNHLSGAGILAVQKHFYVYKIITVLDISGSKLTDRDGAVVANIIRVLLKYCRRRTSGTFIGVNKLTDRDGTVVANIIRVSPQLRVLHAHHNEFRELAGKEIGKVIAETRGLTEMDLSWNHIRQHGAIGIARGIEKNTSLVYINVAWNGFGYEGSVALSDALRHNITLEKLDLACNRIHPPALMELMKGLFCNKVLKVLILDRNPLTPSFTSILLEGILRNINTMALEELSLKGVVVDRDFQGILDAIQQERECRVEFETSLPVSCRKRDDMMKEVEMRNNYNIEPLRMLYLLKERNRAQDFFHKINKDHNDGLTPDELSMLFKETGLPVSKYVIDRIMQFMDTDRDGKIDLGEFLIGDKKMKKITRDHARNTADTQYTHYSRTFRKAHIQQLTSRLQVEEIQPQYLSPIASATPSQASSRRSSLNYP